MTKCTLCVDRIYDPLLAPEDRQPACVKACPTGARLFGDVKDPDSEVARAIRERGGYSLMPEWQTRPANQYLPRRITEAAGDAARETRELGGEQPSHSVNRP
jgi:sulfite dehydrogenase (quinone) subunit SoeB